MCIPYFGVDEILIVSFYLKKLNLLIVQVAYKMAITNWIFHFTSMDYFFDPGNDCYTKTIYAVLVS